MRAPRQALSTLSTFLIVWLLGGCESGGTLASPVVRVDLRDKLPPAGQRQIALADSSYECRHKFELAAGGARQAFLATFRVFELGDALHLTAVEIDAEGQTSGASSPTATALVDEISYRKQGERTVAMVPVRVTWTASQGCGRVSASSRLELRADHSGCLKPKSPGKLLTPVP